jgi:leader peptidase (prepilin peptidase)/N-methyltransferase
VTLDAFLQVFAALFGLIAGSYLNVVVYRLPRGISTVLPRSRCPRCRMPVRPWDNVPVLSFLLLGGRCRSCRVAISWRYPLVEAATAACFVASFREFRPSLTGTVIAWVFCAAMIALALIDFEHYLLPDVITLPGVAVGLLVLPRLGWTSDRDAWLGAALGAGVLLAVAWGWYALKRVHGMGLGDVKMLAMVGAFLGWKGTVSTLFVASLAGSLVGLSMMAAGRLRMQSRLPFGVFLALGALVTLFFRHEIVALYGRFGLALARWLLG